MSGTSWKSPRDKIIPAFIDGYSRACRVCTCGSGHMAGILALQFFLMCFLLTPQPLVDQRAPRCQLLQMVASSWMMRILASLGGIEGVKSVAVAAAYALGLEALLSAARRDFISAY